MAGLPINLVGSLSGMFGSILKILFGLLFVGLVGAAAYVLVYKRKAYDTRVIIFSERGGKVSKIYYDWARFTKNKETGAAEIHLQKSKVSLPTVNYSSLVINKKGQSVLFFRETADNILYPISQIDFPKDDIISASALENDLALLAAAEKKYTRSLHDKPKMWEKLLPIIGPAVTGIIVLMIVYLAVDKMGDIGDKLNSIIQVCQAAGNAV